ncbi:MAG: YSC84-related protein [Desulfobacterales bacterium]
MKRAAMLVIISIMFSFILSAPVIAADEDKILQERYRIREMARDGLASLYEVNPVARFGIERAAGYGVFSTFGIKIFFAGGTNGQGVVHNSRTERDTFMKMIGAQAGLGLGVKKDRVIWVFETESALSNFVNSGWEFGGQMSATAMVQNQGGTFAGAFSVAPGVFVYQLTETGLAAGLTVSGTKYYKNNELN